MFGRTVRLELKDLPNMKLIPFHPFKDLHSLHLSGLSWDYVFLANLVVDGSKILQMLEDLDIRNCRRMKAVIKDEVDEVSTGRVFVFPRLKSLKMDSLPSPSSFSSEPNAELNCPSLESLHISSCYEIQSFCSGPFIAPKLSSITVDHKVHQIQAIDELNQILQSLYESNQQKRDGLSEGDKSQEEDGSIGDCIEENQEDQSYEEDVQEEDCYSSEGYSENAEEIQENENYEGDVQEENRYSIEGKCFGEEAEEIQDYTSGMKDGNEEITKLSKSTSQFENNVA